MRGANYYTLVYTPANRNWKGEFRKVQVKLAEKGYTLEYRPGYYAEDAEKVEGKEPLNVADSTSPAMKVLNAAMAYGSPQPENVVLKVAVSPATGQPEDGVAKKNLLAPQGHRAVRALCAAGCRAAAGIHFYAGYSRQDSHGCQAGHLRLRGGWSHDEHHDAQRDRRY